MKTYTIEYEKDARVHVDLPEFLTMDQIEAFVGQVREVAIELGGDIRESILWAVGELSEQYNETAKDHLANLVRETLQGEHQGKPKGLMAWEPVIEEEVKS